MGNAFHAPRLRALRGHQSGRKGVPLRTRPGLFVLGLSSRFTRNVSPAVPWHSLVYVNPWIEKCAKADAAVVVALVAARTDVGLARYLSLISQQFGPQNPTYGAIILSPPSRPAPASLAMAKRRGHDNLGQSRQAGRRSQTPAADDRAIHGRTGHRRSADGRTSAGGVGRG